MARLAKVAQVAPDEAIARTCVALVESALEAVVETLQRRPELRAKLRDLLGLERGVAPEVAEHMTVAEYAAYRRVSERTVRYQLGEMHEGVEYHRAGRKKGRVVMDVREADRWHDERARATSSSVEALAVDEVTRRRARVALTNQRERK